MLATMPETKAVAPLSSRTRLRRMNLRGFLVGLAGALGAIATGHLERFAPSAAGSEAVNAVWMLDSGTLDLGIVRDSILNPHDFQVFGEIFEGVARVGRTQVAKVWIHPEFAGVRA